MALEFGSSLVRNCGAGDAVQYRGEEGFSSSTSSVVNLHLPAGNALGINQDTPLPVWVVGELEPWTGTRLLWSVGWGSGWSSLGRQGDLQGKAAFAVGP